MCNEEENEMSTNTLEKEIADAKKSRINKALKEVELMQKGHLPKKSARDFLRESRNK